MVQLQVISKILASKSTEILDVNLITPEYFTEYRDEMEYILKHKEQYGTVPDVATFLSTFSDVELVDVQESDRYLVDKIREEYLYYRSVPVIQKAAELLKTDANAAAEYMNHAMQEIQPEYNLGGIDIVADAQVRYEEYTERKQNQDNWFFTSGFEELDALIHGIQRSEELIVLVARINQGKSWISEKITTHIWQLGYNVGYISPEMSATSIGYRFDTLYSNMSNKALMWSTKDVETEQYGNYIEQLKEKKNRFIVATPQDFNRVLTVTKLKQWIQQYKLDMIAIDGITYLRDERAVRGDTKSTALTNISEDLMSLSVELKVPILVVVQANRSGVTEEEDTPELEHIKDSDGIGANASKVLSLKQTKDGVLKLQIKKQRFGPVGGKLSYKWDIDTGVFTFIPSYEDAEPKERTERKVKEMKKKYNDKEDVF